MTTDNGPMTISEDQRVLLFLGVIIIIYTLSAGILVRTVLSRIRRRPRSLTPLRRLAERSILLFALSGVLCMAYGFFLEPYWPAVTHVQITSPNLPPGSSPIRIGAATNLHELRESTTNGPCSIHGIRAIRGFPFASFIW